MALAQAERVRLLRRRSAPGSCAGGARKPSTALLMWWPSLLNSRNRSGPQARDSPLLNNKGEGSAPSPYSEGAGR